MGSLGKPQFYNIINSEKRSSGKNHQVTDPRTEEPLWDAPIASAEDLEETIAAANKAFKTWSRSTIAERQEALKKMADIVKDNSDELSELTMRETGKSVRIYRLEGLPFDNFITI